MVKSTGAISSRTLLLLIYFALIFCLIACGNKDETSATGDAAIGAHISSFSGEPTSLTVTAGQSIVLTVEVTDSEDEPVGNATVNFQFTDNSSGATLTILSHTTDSAGQAVALYKAGSINPTADVEDTVRARVSGSTKAVTITRKKPSGLNLTLASNLTNNQMPSGGNASLTATVLDASGNPVNGVTVTFNVITNNSGATIITGNATTDDTGEAIWVYTAGSTAGVDDSITATVSGGGYESTDTIVMLVR